jgi:hypothetical protein
MAGVVRDNAFTGEFSDHPDRGVLQTVINSCLRGIDPGCPIGPSRPLILLVFVDPYWPYHASCTSHFIWQDSLQGVPGRVLSPPYGSTEVSGRVAISESDSVEVTALVADSLKC